MKSIVDVERLRVVEVNDLLPPPARVHAEVVIVGGGLGGVAAAIAAGEAGRTVTLIEETEWLGGQATSQGVSALDENQYVDTSGGTRSYHGFKHAIREQYLPLRRAASQPVDAGKFNPGNGWVSRLCFEPKTAVTAIERRIAPFVESGHLRVLERCKAYAVGRGSTRIQYVDVVNLDNGDRHRLTGDFFIDASELGDLLALGAADFVTGAESRMRTAEPQAAEVADAEDVQSFTYTFAIESCPGEDHRISQPPDYARNLKEQPYTLVIPYKGRGNITYGMFKKVEGSPGSFWTYRRLIDASQFDASAYPRDIAMINWPGNDYRGGNILVDDPQQQIAHLSAAKALSLGLLYWLQHDVARSEPRTPVRGQPTTGVVGSDSDRGYPEFKLRPDVMGTADGLSKFPYIRESRRIVAVRTILEQEVAASVQKGPRAAHFRDSVGIGLYSIDLHESKRSRRQVTDRAQPFQVPLGALIPQDAVNLLAGCKNIGTTHVTNGCYRLHPIEWNIGESAGETAAMCLELGVMPRELRDDPRRLLELQRRLVRRGVPIMWYDDVPVDDPRFERIQMRPFESPEILAVMPKDLHAL